MVCELRASRCLSWIYKRQRNQRTNCQYLLDLKKVGLGENFIKTSASLTMLKPLTVWITTNHGKFFKMGMPDHLTCLLRTCMKVKKQQLKLDMEQRTGFKSEKEYDEAVYCHPTYLTYMQSTDAKCWAG